MNLRRDWMDIVAITGYSLLLVFSLYKLNDTMSRPMDLFANILLLIGLTSLIMYHVKKLQLQKDEASDAAQKNVRLVAHAAITSFLLITLTPLSAANFRFYDWFALFGHSTLFVSVWRGLSQLFGVSMLALYFIFATGRKFNQRGPELLQLVGRGLMTVFFVTASAQGLTAHLA